MARRLRLQKFELKNVNYQYLGAFKLRVEASPVDAGADPGVFLYQRGPANPYTGEAEDVFLGVAGPVDMSDYPAGGPDGRTAYPFYRATSVELDLRSTSTALSVWTLLVAEVDQLLRALDRMEQLVPAEDVVVGGP